MNTKDAVYLTGHNHPGGVPALAARMGMDTRELSRKLNPNAIHGISLDEAEVIMALSGDHRILHAMAAELGYVCRPALDADSGDAYRKKVLRG